jgi:hypothetical protein
MVNLKCPWDMCEHCNLGVCECKEDVELKTVTYSDHEEFMVCKSFKVVDVIESFFRPVNSKKQEDPV